MNKPKFSLEKATRAVEISSKIEGHKIPNKATEETLRRSQNGEELHEVSNTKQLFKELNSHEICN